MPRISGTVTGLQRSTTYDFQVRVIDANGNPGDWSNVAIGTTLAYPQTWRVDYSYRSGIRDAGSVTGTFAGYIYDPTDPNLPAGVNTTPEMAYDGINSAGGDILYDWRESPPLSPPGPWLDNAEKALVAATGHTVIATGSYDYSGFGGGRVIQWSPGRTYTILQIQVTITWPAREGVLNESSRNFVVDDQAELDALPDTIAAWWATFQSTRPPPSYGSFDIGDPYEV